MMKTRIITTILFALFASTHLCGQIRTISQLETRLKEGDKKALFEIAQYFDNSKKTRGHFNRNHEYDIMVSSQKVKRIVNENCLFLKNEIVINDSTTKFQFLSFLHQNENKIVFCPLTNSFLITPLDKRIIKYEIKEISESRRREICEYFEEIISYDWVKENGINLLIQERNPKALLLIASEFYKKREEWTGYNYTSSPFSELLEILTGTTIGVEDENGKISWHIERDFYPNPKLNLLTYFANYYSQYLWDDERSIFINPNAIVQPLEKEDLLFPLLYNENDSIAVDAFIQLTTCNPTNVAKLADEYDRVYIRANYSLPTFPYRFLKQLSLLTDYCKKNNIDFIGTKDLQTDISILQTRLSFTERQKTEDKLINSLTLDDITAFEYWALINQDSGGITHSAGRILDKFYSKNWTTLVTNKKHLDCYLKKSMLFNRLGIIGICNSYLRKFTYSSPATLELLSSYQTSDNDIKKRAEKALLLATTASLPKEVPPSIWDGNMDYEIIDLEERLSPLISAAKNDRAISKILSQISYEQIPIALRLIENYTFQDSWRKYSFIDRDFGLDMFGDYDKKETRDEFIKLHSTLSEYELYSFCLDKIGIDYKGINNTLDYDKIYEILKYDVVTAFAGGGGSKRGTWVYSLIKLLEINFNTTLGFPKKLCNSDNLYGCSPDKRAWAWMAFLEKNNYLKLEHNEPISFTFMDLK